MGRFLLRSGLGIVCLGALLIEWVAGARPLSLLLDRVHTLPMETQPVAQIGVEEVDPGMLRINDQLMSSAMPDNHPYPMKMKVDPARQFVLESRGHAIALGEVAESSGENRGIKPGPGDKAWFRIEHSMLSWPTPLAINFMTGHSPSWKRHVYYRFVWEKPDGARLEMLWRYEQYYYESWASGFMTRAGTTGLIRVDIRP